MAPKKKAGSSGGEGSKGASMAHLALWAEHVGLGFFIFGRGGRGQGGIFI